MDDYTRTTSYRRYFNKLQKILSDKVGSINSDAYSSESFSSLVRKFLDKYPRYYAYKSDLVLINDIRNIMIHDEIEDYPVIPSESILNKLIKIYDLIESPPKWDKIGIQANQIFYTADNEYIVDVVKIMAKNTYTHVPVLCNGVFEWLLTESLYLQWISDVMQKDGIITSESYVHDLKKYETNVNDYYVFLPRTADIFQIKEYFEKTIFEKHNNTFKRLGVIFITQNGKKNEKLLGLVTAWDLPKIESIIT